MVKPAATKKLIQSHANAIMSGVVVAIDPATGASSAPGWALFVKGKLKDSGTIKIDGKKPVQSRLNQLYALLRAQIPYPDVLVVERIRGRMAHESLRWSVGVVLAALPAPVVLELPISLWHAHAGKRYVKSDEGDAIQIGETVVEIAKEGRHD